MVDSIAGHAEHMKIADNLGMSAKVERPLKIVFLGAGSVFFVPLFTDVLSIPGADEGEMVIVDIDETRLALASQAALKIIQKKASKWKVTASADRKKVLAGADYVINCIEANGIDCVKSEYHIPLKYRIDQCIGDTTGPGGLMKALRTVPAFLDILKDIEELCPNAWVLNYTNPMSILCLAASRTSKAKVAGLCHSVQGSSHQLAEYLEIPYQKLKWECGGINHLAWFTQLSSGNVDMYDILKEKVLKDTALWEKDPVRFDMMLHFGYFITESSGHLSEYLPYYRKRPDIIKKYCRSGYRGESGYYANNWPKWRKDSDEKRLQQISEQTEIQLERSWEYASYIIQAMETNNPFVIYATVPNKGLIYNLPADGVVEVACLVNNKGIMPTRFDDLPPQCAAICDSNMRSYELAAIACIEKSKEAAIHALMLDPLTAAVCSPAEIKEMALELFKSEQELMPF